VENFLHVLLFSFQLFEICLKSQLTADLISNFTNKLGICTILQDINTISPEISLFLFFYIEISLPLNTPYFRNDEMYKLDKTIHMFLTSICPSSGVQVVFCCISCSALGVVALVLRSRCVVLCTLCTFVSGYKLTQSAQDYTPAP